MPQFLVHPCDVDASRALLRDGEARHLVVVLRARPGDPVLVFDGEGRRWAGRFAGGDGSGARIEALSPLPANEPPVALHLAAAVPKGERWDWLLEKATELGVTEIHPVSTGRTVAHVPAERAGAKVERWRQRLVAAAKQCERGRVPRVEPPLELGDFCSGLGARGPGEVRVVLAERSGAPGPRQEGPAPSRVVLAVGPEGGWEPGELRRLEGAGFSPLGLGPRVLRAETAAVAGLCLVQSRWGDLVTPPGP